METKDTNNFYEAIRDNPVIYASYSTNVRCDIHFHKSIELIYVLDGTFNLWIEGSYFQPKEHEIIYIPSYALHQIYPMISKSITIIIPENYIVQFYQMTSNKSFEFILKDIQFNKQFLLNYCKNLLNFEKMNNLQISGNIQSLLGNILEHYKLIDRATKNDCETVTKIVQYIENNYKYNIKLEEIAKEFSYNKHYFSKLFNKMFCCTFNTYVNNVRVSHIAAKLIEGEKNITQLAYDHGFESISTFYRNFQSMFKTSPSNFAFKKIVCTNDKIKEIV